MNGKTLLCYAAGAIFVAAVGWLVLFGPDRFTGEREAFEGQLAAFLGSELIEAGADDEPRDPKRCKAVLIDKEEGRLSPYQFEIADSFRAASPDEVSVVVWVTYTKDNVGEYVTKQGQSVGAAHVPVVKLVLIDFQRRKVVGSQEFRGSAPPDQVYEKGDASGVRPLTILISDDLNQCVRRACLNLSK